MPKGFKELLEALKGGELDAKVTEIKGDFIKSMLKEIVETSKKKDEDDKERIYIGEIPRELTKQLKQNKMRRKMKQKEVEAELDRLKVKYEAIVLQEFENIHDEFEEEMEKLYDEHKKIWETICKEKGVSPDETLVVEFDERKLYREVKKKKEDAKESPTDISATDILQ
jgi:hypothetical protein